MNEKKLTEKLAYEILLLFVYFQVASLAVQTHIQAKSEFGRVNQDQLNLSLD